MQTIVLALGVVAGLALAGVFYEVMGDWDWRRWFERLFFQATGVAAFLSGLFLSGLLK